MDKEVWQSRDKQIVARYAERLEQGDPEARAPGDDPDPTESAAPEAGSASKSSDGGRTEVDFNYSNGVVPPRDLLNYKNMDLEMSLWARTQTGWMSVGVLLVLVFVCFLLTVVLWKLRGF